MWLVMRHPTNRCIRRGYREFFKVRYSFAIASVVVGYVVSAATPLNSSVMGIRKEVKWPLVNLN